MVGLINLAGGLSEMGKSVAESEDDMSQMVEKAQLQKQMLMLASQLKGEQYDVQAKKLALIPQAASVDAYLKAIGHPGGLSDFGMNTGSDVADGDTGDSAATTAPSARAPAANTPSTKAAAPADDQDQSADDGASYFPKGAPVVTPIGGKGKVLGIPLPPGWTPQMAAIAGPEKLSAAWEKFSAPGAIRSGSALPYFNFSTGKMETLFQQPNAPMGSFYDRGTNSYVRIGHADEAIEGAEYAKSRGESQGSLPADLAKIRETGGQTRATEAYKAGVEAATTLVPSYDPATQSTTYLTKSDALDMVRSGRRLTAPPEGNNQANANPNAAPPDVGLQKDGSYKTLAGTRIPAPPKINGPRNGLQAEPSAADKATQSTYGDVIKGWEQSVEPAALAEQRFQTIAQAMKATTTGAWPQTKYEIAHKLMSLDLMNEQDAQKLLGSDISAAQVMLKNNFSAALDTLSSARLGRITQNEIFQLQKNLPSLGLQPKANLEMLAQGIGIARYQQRLAGDWNTARQIGYADPLTYQDNWNRANPVQGFVDQAKQDIGSLKGTGDANAAYPVPPTAAVDRLKRLGPTAKGQFDQIFGPGAADRALGAH